MKETESKVKTEETKKTQEMMDAVQNSPDFICKTIVIGKIGAGKSCLLHRASKGEFLKKGATICTDRVMINTRIQDQRICSLEVWDTAGAEEYSSMTDLYYRDA